MRFGLEISDWGACKTGTPQTHEFPNSTFICFAPVEDPQIAIAVVIEKGWHGYTGAPVAREVLDAYFFPEKEHPEVAPGNKLPDGRIAGVLYADAAIELPQQTELIEQAEQPAPQQVMAAENTVAQGE